MSKVFVVTNRKGGCGKSFTTASLGFALARKGKKVLCIDTDNQHSLTVSMGVKEPDKLPITIANVIAGIISKKGAADNVNIRGNSPRNVSAGERQEGFCSATNPAGITIDSTGFAINPADHANSSTGFCLTTNPTAGIIHHEEGVDLMPANNSLTGIELALASLYGRENILRKYLNNVKHLYDYCLIDTSPTIDILTINALAAADSAIIPVTPKYLDAKGLELLLRSIADIREDINPELDICGILMTMVDKRTNFSKEIIGVIEQAYGEHIHIFKDHIPHSIRAAESCATGKSIFSYDLNGKVAAAYESLVEDILGRDGDGVGNGINNSDSGSDNDFDIALPTTRTAISKEVQNHG